MNRDTEVFDCRTTAGCDLNQLVQTLAYVLQCDHRYRDIEVILDSDAQLPKTTADAEQIQCVLLGLLTRARKAIMRAELPHGTITLHTAIKAGKIQLSITDDGAPDPASGIFETFFTMKLEEWRNFAVHAQIVQNCGGELYVWRPHHSAGTTVIVDLPIEV